MKSDNPNISYVYDYILKNKNSDGDFWSLGGGSVEIQYRLNDFKKEDWEDLKNEILNWNERERYILLNSITYGFDDWGYPELDDKVITDAGNFYLDMFILIDDVDKKSDIAFNGFFINKSGTKDIEKLKIVRDWILETKNFEFTKSLKYIEETIEKSCLEK